MTHPGWVQYAKGLPGSVQLTKEVAAQAIYLLQTTSDVHLRRDFPAAGDKWIAAMMRKVNDENASFMKLACHYREIDTADNPLVDSLDIVVLFQRMRKSYPPPAPPNDYGVWVFSLGFDHSPMHTPLPEVDPGSPTIPEEYLKFVGTIPTPGYPAYPGELEDIFQWHWDNVPRSEQNILHTVGDLPEGATPADPSGAASQELRRKIQLVERAALSSRSKWEFDSLNPYEDIQGYGKRMGPVQDHYWGGSSVQRLRIYNIVQK